MFQLRVQAQVGSASAGAPCNEAGISLKRELHSFVSSLRMQPVAPCCSCLLTTMVSYAPCFGKSPYPLRMPFFITA